MKRNIAALLLGLALTGSSIAVYAEDAATEAAAQETTSDSSEIENQAGQSELISGRVNDITEDSLSLSLGTLTEGEAESDSQGSQAEQTSEESTDSSDTSEDQPSSSDVTLVLTGEEAVYTYSDTMTVTEDPQQYVVTVMEEAEASDDTTDSTDYEASDVSFDTADTTESSDDASSSDSVEIIGEDASSDDADTQEDASDDTSSAAEDLTIEDIQVGDIVSLQLNDSGEIEEIILIGSDETEHTDESSDEVTDTLINEDSSDEAATEQSAAEEVE